MFDLLDMQWNTLYHPVIILCYFIIFHMKAGDAAAGSPYFDFLVRTCRVSHQIQSVKLAPMLTIKHSAVTWINRQLSKIMTSDDRNDVWIYDVWPWVSLTGAGSASWMENTSSLNGVWNQYLHTVWLITKRFLSSSVVHRKTMKITHCISRILSNMCKI